jgi:hypothetical protein
MLVEALEFMCKHAAAFVSVKLALLGLKCWQHKVTSINTIKNVHIESKWGALFMGNETGQDGSIKFINMLTFHNVSFRECILDSIRVH